MRPTLEQQYSLAGQTAVITGAHTGIGRGCAMALAACGANLVLWDRAGGDELDSTAREVRDSGVSVDTNVVDLRDLDAVREKARMLIAERRVDILVNNAGTIHRAPAIETTLEDWRNTLSINLDAMFVLSQELVVPMLKRGNGHIVNIASLLSFQGGINVVAYTASKHAVVGVTKAMANEYAARGVNVNAVAPGYIETNNTAALRSDAKRSAQISSRIPAGRWGTPDDVAGAVAFLCAPAAAYINGHVLVVDGGWMSW